MIRTIIGELAEAHQNISLAVMQPYFFPYIGYYQLMSLVNTFIVLDDVHFIKQGWINRNRLLFRGAAKFFTLPLVGASSNKVINQLVIHQPEKSKRQICNQIVNYYRKAPFFEIFYHQLEKWLMHPEDRLSPYLCHTLREVAAFIGLKMPRMMLASELPRGPDKKGQERVIELCRTVGARCYINVIAGRELYDPLEFQRQGIQLLFQKAVCRPYPQLGQTPLAGLSVIDMLMFNQVEQVRVETEQHELTGPD